MASIFDTGPDLDDDITFIEIDAETGGITYLIPEEIAKKLGLSGGDSPTEKVSHAKGGTKTHVGFSINQESKSRVDAAIEGAGGRNFLNKDTAKRSGFTFGERDISGV